MDSPENPPTSMEVARTLVWPAHSYSSYSGSPSTSTSSSSTFAFCPAGFPLFCLFRHRSTCWFNSSGVPDSLSLQTGQDASSAFRFRFLTRILACAKKNSNAHILIIISNYHVSISCRNASIYFFKKLRRCHMIHESLKQEIKNALLVYWPWSFCMSPIYPEGCHPPPMVRAASGHGDDLGDASAVRSTLRVEVLKMPRRPCTIDRALEQNVALVLEVSLSLRTPGSKMDPREISFCLKNEKISHYD